MCAASKQRNGNTCVICEQSKQKGIHLYTSFICVDCEQVLVNTKTEDPQYKYYVKQLSRVNREKAFLK